ncbi:MAG: InlB B-repeat-containing protein [Paludibacteraceae bacterium]|nr:InlB B-repeat-containing protein [Paludibacteraceae bacterium]
MMNPWKRAQGVQLFFILLVLLLAPMRAFSVGWTPTDGGLVLNLEQDDRFLLSVMVDHDNNPSTPDREYFVVNYSRYEGDDYFHYKNAQGKFIYADGKHLKLAQQDAHATKPSDMSIWRVGAPLARGKYDLGGIAYTIWNDGKTLRTSDSFKFLGDVTENYNDAKAADVVFVIPTNHTGIESFDPNKTLRTVYNRTDQDPESGRINGAIGTGFLGMVYREVYMLDIPKANSPQSYTNASLVTFNTTNSTQIWSEKQITCYSGFPAYAYADNKHKPTYRTLFRLYMLDKPIQRCSSYFFATDEQDYKKYRKVDNPKSSADSTAAKKIYTWDYFNCMEPVDKASSKIYKTDYMFVPVPDSTYYYVGYNNEYCNGSGATPSEPLGSSTAKSAFEKIRNLPLLNLPTFKAPAGAFGQMVVDTSETADNLGVKFEPAGYFLKVSSGKNVSMHDNGDGTWITEEMWTIDEEWVGKTIKATLMTGSSFSETDPGADVAGWSIDVFGSNVPVKDHDKLTPAGQSGYAQITTNSTAANGNMVFILANKDKWLRYDNNGLVGLEMPLQYPLEGSNTVTLLQPRIKPGYTFYGWCKKADGSSDTLKVGSTYTLTQTGADTLYALASYDGTLQIAISFLQDGKRYFLTHPGMGTGFRFARARHFDSWVNTWQGMENAQNLDTNYLSTYEVRCPINEIKKKEPGLDSLYFNEHVLDPRSYTMKGLVDSLTFYENFHPSKDEHIGLYYMAPNVILANNTWAGLFTTTSKAETSWPTFKQPYIPSAKIRSERFVEEYDPENKPDSLILKKRTNFAEPYVIYDPVNNQFNGQADSASATDFQLSAISVADEHYIILPDTAYAWSDTITFDFHEGEKTTEDIWSALIGKQLLAVMVVDGDTVYFHPNRDKIISDPNNLYLSPDFRITQIFEWIPDSRVTSVAAEDRVAYSTTGHYWHHTVTRGLNPPLNVKDASGNYIDILDTFCITLSQGRISKIKKYYGRWKKQGENDGLTISADGLTRQRNIIVKTKTYHYGEEQTRMVLKPEKERYGFGALAGQSQKINFILTRVHVRDLLDAQGAFVREDTISIDTLTAQLGMLPGKCTFRVGTAFEKVEAETSGRYATLSTKADNTSGVNYDTLVVTGYRYDNEDYDCNVRVPLIQAPLEGDELIWSVMHNGQRYFIMAGKGTTQDSLIFRQYTQKGNTLYKRVGGNQLIKGAKDTTNRDEGYITPWYFSYVNQAAQQLTLRIGLTASDTLHFNITSGTTPAVGDTTSTLTYVFTDVYANTNANYEEQVKLKYGLNQWLKFNGSALVLTTNELEADTFSWAYPLLEFNLLNNGTYPSHEQVVFGYNTNVSVSVKTAYQGYCEYSMLLNNKLTYFGRETRTSRAALINTDSESRWKTTCVIERIRDSRTTTESGIDVSEVNDNFVTTVKTTTEKPSPTEVKIGDTYIDIVDTLCVTLGLQKGAPDYRYKDKWSGFSTISDGNLKIPLVRRTYHEAPFDSLICTEANEVYHYSFPSTITKGVNDTVLLQFQTIRHHGTQLLNTSDEVISVISSTSSNVTHDIKKKGSATADSIIGMHLNDKDLAEVRLMDEYGNTPTWCKIKAKGDSTITVQCLSNGVRSPRSVDLYLVYVITLEEEQMNIVTYRLTISQASYFNYANNQQLVHTSGASGDPIGVDGLQQVHQNKRILYYYPDQDVELPIRERNFYGWWRWYREGNDVNGKDVSDSDIPDSLWRLAPRNVGKYNYPYHIIGDSVKVWDEEKKDSVKVLMTMGRWTVFHYRSKDYGSDGSKKDPPAKNARVAPPITDLGLATKPTLTYAVDISNYYDNLPLSLSQKNQVDTALLDTILEIKEPTLSIREVFELHPWTEMADTLDHYKSRITGDEKYPLAGEKYMEDHVVMAPTGTKLLLSTEQRYNYNNLHKTGLSESLLGYYMHDDNWSNWSADKVRQDTMIWCGGWDADCLWYIYNSKTQKYTRCDHPITESDDFLKVPVKNNVDTVYYCLRARSWKTLSDKSGEDSTVVGDYYFNICRYKICYHYPNIYGPKVETKSKKETRALITNDEIEQRYEVLERLNFDYNEPGNSYTVYPHPLPWADASYGYTYPETADLPHNRRHDETDFPNHGEYGLINRIGYTTYWFPMEQHGGASKGYMIYCDGMSSSGQVAALSLNKTLCAGQKMFLSAYVGNPSNQTKEVAKPNFIFSVQGSVNGTKWDDITTYMTGDLDPSDKWYQILFPINHTREGSGGEYVHFRVRIYNMASDFDGNDFIIDDICIFATKPPLIAYQASTACKEEGDTKDTHVILRVDYKGMVGSTGDGDAEVEEYNGHKIFYTVKGVNKSGETRFVRMEDGYVEEDTLKGSADPYKPDTLYGKVYIPLKTYEPTDSDSIFTNMNDLLDRFEETFTIHQEHLDDPSKPDTAIFREGYVYEVLEGESRPVKYLIHMANLNPEDEFTVHMYPDSSMLLSSICGLTSRLKVSNRMLLELNGMEQPYTEVMGMCVNSTYNVSLRVKGSLYLDSVAPIDLNGSCINDWLLYGDTAEASSKERYGYYYSDIKKVLRDVLRVEGANVNQFAPNLSSINKNVLKRNAQGKEFKQAGLDAYDMISSLVNNGFLTLYQRKQTVTVTTGDTAKFVIFPIVGTGTDALSKANIEVCPAPIFVKLSPDTSKAALPLIIGGLHRDSTQMRKPIEVLLSETVANDEFKLRVDSIAPKVGIKTITLSETNDPNFLDGIHTLSLIPDKDYLSDIADYYEKGDSILFVPAPDSYHMRPGYSYTFNINLQDYLGHDTIKGGCAVGTVPFILSVVPSYLRWEPQSEHSNGWNNADNWIAIDAHNNPIPTETHFAPMAGISVLIPKMEDGVPYPVVPPMPTEWKDSVQKVNFEYNTCNAIRFLPEAAMGQQQRMEYNDAVADMSMPYNKWAFRGAPVKGMISGDLFRANADLNGETPLWEVGEFDAAGRNHNTGNTSFWLSLYSRTTLRKGNGEDTEDTIRNATADWSKVTNGLSLPLPAGMGWAVYSRSHVANETSVVRLPKQDDKYYYYSRSGDKMYDLYEHNLQDLRTTVAGGSDAGKLAFHADYEEYTITNDTMANGTRVTTSSFVFANPSMGYLDIWGFVADNCLKQEIDYIDASGTHRTVSRAVAESKESPNSISNETRYLPPMHAMVVKLRDESAVNSKTLVLNAYRVLTEVEQKVPAVYVCGGGGGDQELAQAPRRMTAPLREGIMTVTAINPVSPRCNSRLILGQGYHEAIIQGEDAMLTTVNIDNFHMTNTPTTPFNIYAMNDGYGLSIDLRDSIVNVPVSFYMSALPYDPTTELWFTGVNNIDGSLVLYDALLDTERPICDGICITIETPTQNHERRYYIRRPGYMPDEQGTTTGNTITYETNHDEQAVKIIRNDQVLILRGGHVYTVFGQKIR